MRISCIIDNYNYGEYLPEAVESALRQTRPFDEILIVDDGSTDGSREYIASLAGNAVIVPVVKANGGQLSAINAGLAVATGDIVFFLDSDDAYLPSYVEETLSVYAANPSCDFVFCDDEKFGEGCDRPYPSFHGCRGGGDLGYSVVRTYFTHAWIGSVLSTISIRRKFLEKILPIRFPEDWRTRADDCIIWGASLAGARKHFLDRKLVRYRIHANNKWFRKKFGPETRYIRGLAIQRLFDDFSARLNLSGRIGCFAYEEFTTIPSPSLAVVNTYRKIILRHMYVDGYTKIMKMYLAWLGSRLGWKRNRSSAPVAIPEAEDRRRNHGVSERCRI